MREPQRSLTSGERTRRSSSGQRRYTVIGFSEVIGSPEVKSEPLRERMTVSVRSGRILADSVPSWRGGSGLIDLPVQIRGRETEWQGLAGSRLASLQPREGRRDEGSGQKVWV